MATKKPTEKLGKTRGIKGDITRKKVETATLKGLNNEQIAREVGISRQRVEQIKAEPDFRQRIAATCEAAANLSVAEVLGTLANQMRADVTDLFTDDGGFDLKVIRRRRLGHLIKRVKVRREVEGKGDDKQPVDIIEIEVYSSQAAAIQLSKNLGIEELPKANNGDVAKWNEIIKRIAEKYKKPIEEVKADLIAHKPELATMLIQ